MPQHQLTNNQPRPQGRGHLRGFNVPIVDESLSRCATVEKRGDGDCKALFKAKPAGHFAGNILLEIKMKFLNYTPHAVNLNDGRQFDSVGVARVAASFTQPVDNICRQEFGDIQGLPKPQDGVKYIVSLLVLQASDRDDLVAPASGHPDTVRDKGMVVSVPCFVGK